jgi:hypothetical protein
MKIMKIDALGRSIRVVQESFEILYHNGIGLNAEFKDRAVCAIYLKLLIMSEKCLSPYGSGSYVRPMRHPLDLTHTTS